MFEDRGKIQDLLVELAILDIDPPVNQSHSKDVLLEIRDLAYQDRINAIVEGTAIYCKYLAQLRLACVVARLEKGARKYGARLCSSNGRPIFVDSLQEALDGYVYVSNDVVTLEQQQEELLAMSPRCAYDAARLRVIDHQMIAARQQRNHWEMILDQIIGSLMLNEQDSREAEEIRARHRRDAYSMASHIKRAYNSPFTWNLQSWEDDHCEDFYAFRLSGSTEEKELYLVGACQELAKIEPDCFTFDFPYFTYVSASKQGEDQ